MEDNTLRLGIACLAALTSLAVPASSAVRDPVAEARDSCGTARHCDALIEFMMATGGDFSPEKIGPGLDAAFGEIGARYARDVSRFMRDLEALGITPEQRDGIEAQLVEKIRLSDLSTGRKTRFLDRLAEVPGGAGCYTLSESGSDVTSAQDACRVSFNAYQT